MNMSQLINIIPFVYFLLELACAILYAFGITQFRIQVPFACLIASSSSIPLLFACLGEKALSIVNNIAGLAALVLFVMSWMRKYVHMLRFFVPLSSAAMLCSLLCVRIQNKYVHSLMMLVLGSGSIVAFQFFPVWTYLVCTSVISGAGLASAVVVLKTFWGSIGREAKAKLIGKIAEAAEAAGGDFVSINVDELNNRMKLVAAAVTELMNDPKTVEMKFRYGLVVFVLGTAAILCIQKFVMHNDEKEFEKDETEAEAADIESGGTNNVGK